ncbi:MAG: LarC family nickel insertion protein [Candidatus Accumulibacter sp.]|jgi:uncharacterized protein (TIGR00299 family) protein|nr:LarC family nickel insertion protein [Accumulibacter sp.]
MAEYDHIHLDAAGGLAGDMFAAALLDALPELWPRVSADLAAAIPARCGHPVLSEGLSGGVAARRFMLAAPSGGASPGQGREGGHRHGGHPHGDHSHGDHGHGDHGHGDHGHGDHHHAHDHAARFPEIAAMIGSASLHAGTAKQAIAILRRLAEAESRMHGVPVEEVHFHELADWDSLMDVVAAGSIAAALAHCAWSVSDLPLGGGLVSTRHGLLPVPAPATVEILRGFRWRDDGVGGERVTPTGAAILAHLVRDPQAGPGGGLLRATGAGAGARELPDMPNILRALVFSRSGADANAPAENGGVIVLHFDIDDMTGEEIAVAANRLRAAAGVIDLTVAARQGKKGRPASEFRLLVEPAALDAVCDRCFAETTTIGLRWHPERRRCLPRRQEILAVDGQRVTRKRTLRPDGSATFKVESDDVARLEGLAARRRLKCLGERGECCECCENGENRENGEKRP